jgi:hypothetical protein
MRNENILRYRTKKKERWVSASFLKKSSKKLLLAGGDGKADVNAPKDQAFFCFFFSKKKRLLTFLND